MKRLVLGLAVVALVISVVPSVFASCVCVCEYSPGYWKHNVRVYVEGQGSYAADIYDIKEAGFLMECYEAWIQDNIDPDFSLEWANEQFWMRGPGRQPIRQMIADWFNAAKELVKCAIVV